MVTPWTIAFHPVSKTNKEGLELTDPRETQARQMETKPATEGELRRGDQALQVAGEALTRGDTHVKEKRGRP